MTKNTLLEKTRILNGILLNSGKERVVFSELCKIISELMECNVFLTSRKGKVLGHNMIIGTRSFDDDAVYLSSATNHYLMGIINPAANQQLNFALGLFEDETRDMLTTIIPIHCGGERLGSLIIQRQENAPEFDDEDLVLSEYSSTVVGLEIMRAQTREIEEEAQEKAMVQMAVNSLSYSELEAAHEILSKLKEKEGLVVASRIADEAGITRSVIVNALRKLESAGVLESRSLGMKGTFIKILNKRIWEQLDSLL